MNTRSRTATRACCLYMFSALGCAPVTTDEYVFQDAGSVEPEDKAETTADSRCAMVNEATRAALSCPSAQVIGAITSATYGTPTGSCPSFSVGACHASSAKSAVEAACSGKPSCTVDANNGTFGDPCGGFPKRLAVTYTCKGGTAPPLPTAMPVFLLAGQSNMVGNTDRALHDGLMAELATGSAETLQPRLQNRLSSWYQNWNNGYAMYGYSPQMVAFEAAELVRLNRIGLASASLSQPYPKVLCTFDTTSQPQPLALNCGGPYGAELVLGRVLGTTKYSPTSLIKVAQGGTSLYVNWLPPSAARRTGRPVGPLYTDLSRRIKSLQTNPASVHPDCASRSCRWAGFVWFQGENDAFDLSNAQAYGQNLKDFIADVRSEVGSSKLPVVVVKIGSWAQSLSHGSTVAAAQQAIVAADPYAGLVTTEDLSGFYHYDPAAQLIIGERVAKALIPMLNGQSSPAPSTPGSRCAQASEGRTVPLSCPSGEVVKSITFGSYGTPIGSCPSVSVGACHASNSESAMESACLNKPSCNIGANNATFGDPCGGVPKQVAVVYACGASAAAR